MKILMFGRGTIATLYGWAFEKAGHTVEFYVRPGRAAQLGPSVKFDLLDARKKARGEVVQGSWPVVLREDLPADHDYDLIIVSVNLGAFPEAARFLGPRVGKATVLVFNTSGPTRKRRFLPSPTTKWSGGFRGEAVASTSTGCCKAGS